MKGDYRFKGAVCYGGAYFRSEHPDSFGLYLTLQIDISRNRFNFTLLPGPQIAQCFNDVALPFSRSIHLRYIMY